MNDGQARSVDRAILEVLPHGGDVERTSAQSTRESTTPFGEVEALRVGVQPGSPTRSVTARVHHGKISLTEDDTDDPQQSGPLATSPAPHARAHRTLGRIRGEAGLGRAP